MAVLHGLGGLGRLGRVGRFLVSAWALPFTLASCGGVGGTDLPPTSKAPAGPAVSSSLVPSSSATGAGAKRAEPPLAAGEPRVVQIVVGAYHSCVLLGDGTVRCAGNNDHGQLGIGTFDGDKHPVLTPVRGLRDVGQLAAGWTHTCATGRDQRVSCWGDDWSRLAGAAGYSLRIGWGTPHVVPIGGVAARQLALGGSRALALTPDGDLVSWGDDPDGPDHCRVGEGPPRPCALTPFSLSPPKDVEEVAANGQVVCVRTRAGAVHCRGQDLQSSTFATSQAFEPVSGLHDATTVAVGDDHACAATRRGPLLCWGRNDDGQLGSGRRDTDFRRHPPTAVIGIRGDDVQPFGLALGYHRSCAALRDGSVRCWGAYTLPDGSFDMHADSSRWASEPVPVSGLAHVVRIALGPTHACALTGEGRAFCWGENENGEVADGTREARSRPALVAFTPPAPPAEPAADRSVVATSVAVGAHSCATATDGKLRCWGSNASGALGIGAPDSKPHPRPLVVPGLSQVTKVAAADNRTCALEASGALYCWGDGAWGAIGDGATDTRSAPVRLALSGVADVALGFLHGCALGVDGKARCWGEASQGQLGLDPHGCPYTPTGGFDLGPPPTPACLLAPGPTVPNVPPLGRLLSSFNQSCGVGRAARDLFCWGSPVPGQKRLPARLAAISDVVAARAGYYHGCALSKQGQIWCWGKSSYGEMGTGKLIDEKEHPVRVRTISGATRLWAGGFATCAGFGDGTVKCWGALPNLGNRSGPELHPVAIPELTGAVEADFSMAHGCALWPDGAVRCWGHSSSGAHGGDRMRQTTPLPIRWR